MVLVEKNTFFERKLMVFESKKPHTEDDGASDPSMVEALKEEDMEARRPAAGEKHPTFIYKTCAFFFLVSKGLDSWTPVHH